MITASIRNGAGSGDSQSAHATVAEQAADAADLSRVYGVLRLGAAQAALSVDVLREVIPCPDRLSELPASAPGLLGAVCVRGQVVPVVDLRIGLGQPADRKPGQVVVLMRHAGRLLGLLADGVCGLTRLPSAGLSAMSCGDADCDDRADVAGVAGAAGTRGLLFSGSFERSEDASVVSVLDPAALIRLPGLPLLRETPLRTAGEAATGRAAAAAAHRPLLLVRCGTVGLAIEVTDVHATLPRVSLLPSSLDGETCRGVIDYAGMRLPAVDPLALMELGTLPAGEPCQALLLRYPAGQVALLVSQVIDIVRVAAADRLPLPPLAVRRAELFSAMLRIDSHGEHLVLAAGALRDEPALLALSTLNTRPAAAEVPAGRAAAGRSSAGRVPTVTSPPPLAADRPSSQPGAGDGRSGVAVLTYDIGTEVATRLTQVSEVLPLPNDAARPVSAHPAVTGLFTCRGRSVTLLCLATLLRGRPEQPVAGREARVLMVQVDGAHFGFVVPKLCHIDNTLWEQPQGRSNSRPTAGGPRLLGEHALIEIGAAARRRTLHLIDLQALGRALMEGASCPAPQTAAAARVPAAAPSAAAAAPPATAMRCQTEPAIEPG